MVQQVQIHPWHIHDQVHIIYTNRNSITQYSSFERQCLARWNISLISSVHVRMSVHMVCLSFNRTGLICDGVTPQVWTSVHASTLNRTYVYTTAKRDRWKTCINMEFSIGGRYGIGHYLFKWDERIYRINGHCHGHGTMKAKRNYW